MSYVPDIRFCNCTAQCPQCGACCMVGCSHRTQANRQVTTTGIHVLQDSEPSERDYFQREIHDLEQRVAACSSLLRHALRCRKPPKALIRDALRELLGEDR